MAAFTPGPPSQSGGAAYAGALLPALAQHVELVAVSPEPIAWDGPRIAPGDVKAGDFDVHLHFLADNPDHLFAYRSALQWSGVVVCHELMLPHLLGTIAPDEERLDLIEELGPERAERVLARRATGLATHQEAYLLFVVNRAVRRADAAVVHSRFAKFALEATVPHVPVFQVPTHTGAVPADIGDCGLARDRLGLPRDAFLIGLFGYLGGHKRVTSALRAVASAVPVARRHHVDLRLVVVGQHVGPELGQTVEKLGLQGISTVQGAVDDHSFFEHMAAIDVLLNLRYPTLGETSATLTQAMALGKPVITTDHAQFAEERAAVRVAPDDNEVAGVAEALVTLATCAHCRSRVAEAGRRQAAKRSVAAATAAYVEVIEAVTARGGR